VLFRSPERIIISAAGNIRHEALLEYFQPLFQFLPPAPNDYERKSPRVNTGIICTNKDLGQVHICLGGKAPCLPSEQRFAAAILNTILGGNMSSRLFQEIREKRGLAYSIYSFLSSYMDTGSLVICLACSPQEVNGILELISQEIKKIKNGEITASELKDAYEHLTGGILLGAENTDTRMMRLARNEYVFGRYCTYEEMVQELEKVTIEHVVSLASESFRTGEVSLATLGNFSREELNPSAVVFD
jgi:predicted Zn-dependent peptidase